jgi:hypothetical protein
VRLFGSPQKAMYVAIAVGVVYGVLGVLGVVCGVRRHKRRKKMVKHYGTDHSSMNSNFSESTRY